MLERDTIRILDQAVAELERGFSDLPNIEQEYELERIEQVVMQVARIMQDNYPYFHPYYAGQMLKPPHPIARLMAAG